MKVFTVGLDEKEKQKANEVVKEDMTKIPIDSSQSTPAPSPGPIIIPRGPPRKVKGCGMMTWIVAAFLLILLCLTISEIAYNRQRDQAFLRLKWAELRQRMLGYELLSQAQQQNQQNQQQNQQNQQQQQQPQPPPVVDERLAFSNRRNGGDMEALPLRETPTVAPETKKESEEESHESGEQDARFLFLRALLDKMRQKAEDLGLQGDMQVHVIEVKPMDENSHAFQDGFGEVAVPRQNFGPHPRDEDYDNWENMRHHFPPPPPPPVPAWEFERPQIFPRPRFPEFDRPWMGPQPWENNFQRQPMNQPPFFFADAPQQDRRDFFAPPPPQRMPWPQQQPQWAAPNAFQNTWNSPMYNPYGQEQQPSLGQQNQFPFPVQNQNPIVFPQQQQQQAFPQPQQPQPQQQQPWYMAEEEQPRWDNDWQKHDMPMQPHPAAADVHWVDRTAGEENQGIDNFEKQERFNVPVDIASDEEPTEIHKPEEPHFQVNAWQHTQPKSAEETPASEPIVSSDAVVNNNNKDFLPIRNDPISSIHEDVPHSGEKVDDPLPPIHDDAVDLAKKFNSPFFQIDDPNSFRH